MPPYRRSSFLSDAAAAAGVALVATDDGIVDSAGNPVDSLKAARENFQYLIWALVNTKEFLFNH